MSCIEKPTLAKLATRAEKLSDGEGKKRLEISVKSGKDRVSTPSFVIHRVRFKKTSKKVQ